MRPLNRVTPKLPVTVMETYAVDAPLTTHYRPASCQEVECTHYEHGWKTLVDERTELGQRQADYIRRHSGRAFTEAREIDGLTTFVFYAEQQCFRQHQMRLDRPEVFSVFGGDWRGSTSERQVMRPQDWIERSQENFDRLERLAKGG